MEAIKNRIIKSELVNWKEFKFIQAESFKDLPEEAHNKLKESIKSNNFVESFKVWEDGNMIYCLDGYHRCKILRELEAEGIDVPEKFSADFVECESYEKATELILIYSSLYARITDTGMLDFIKENKIDLDEVMKFVDIPAIDFDRIKSGLIASGQTKEDEFNGELTKNPYSKPGDVYKLKSISTGIEHIIICGDSQDSKNFKKIMGKSKADMVFTSPPYNINMPYMNYEDNLERNEFIDFVVNIGKNLKQILKPGGVIFLNISYGRNAKSEYIDIVYKFMHELKMQLLETIIWYKKNARPINNREDLTRFFEYVYCLYNGEMDVRIEKNEYDIFAVLGEEYVEVVNKGLRRVKSNVWDISSAHAQTENLKACFPLKLPAEGIKLYSNPGNIIFEPFLGSGTVLIACEQLGRICRAVELDPEYMDFSILRWVAYMKAENKEYKITRNDEDFDDSVLNQS